MKAPKRTSSCCCCWPLTSCCSCIIGSCRSGGRHMRPDVELAHCCTTQSSAGGIASLSVRTWLRATVQVTLVSCLGVLLVIWLGAEYEAYQVSLTPNTLHYYNSQSTVCGITLINSPTDDGDVAKTSTTTLSTSSSQEWTTQTFASVEALELVSTSRSVVPDESIDSLQTDNTAINQTEAPSFDHNSTSGTSPNGLDVTRSNTSSTPSSIVAHCGDCGACSTAHDINIYDETRNTLLHSTTTCAKHALFFGRATAERCMQEHVGFTDDCNECWIENIMCDLRKCIFTCMWYGLFQTIDDSAASATGSDGNDSTQKTQSKNALNPCTACDEQRCGPAFVECAGANRRRSGIVSDIQRDAQNEVCHAVHPPSWWTQYPQLLQRDKT